ncbi:MAG: hypothetical protein ACYCTY_12915 [Sulfuricella sp.]
MNNMDAVISNLVGGVLIFFIIAIIVFLVCREIVCWYFKINRNVELLTEIRDLLAAKGNSQGGVAPVVQQGSPAISAADTRQQHTTENSAPSDTQQMEKYGITFDGERYAYGEYKYDRLSDAIIYAKLQNKRSV